MQNGEGWLEPGFNVNRLISYLFKKGVLRGDTSLDNTYYQEPTYRPNLFLEHLATDRIPSSPPDDFVKLTAAQIATAFGIQEAEVSEFNTTINGVNVFSVERSVVYPYLYRVNNCRLKPNPTNPEFTFSATTSFGSRLRARQALTQYHVISPNSRFI